MSEQAVSRDFIFDASNGYYLGDVPTGWQWGSAELDPRTHTIIRTADPAFLAARDSLICHKQRLVHQDRHSGTANIWLEGKLAPCPESSHIRPASYTNLRTGKEYPSEDEMWGSVSDGDTVVLARAGVNGQRVLYAIKVLSVAHRKTRYRPIKSVEEAEQWPS